MSGLVDHLLIEPVATSRRIFKSMNYL